MVLTFNEPSFILPFSGSEPLIMKYRNMPRLQQDLMSEKFKGNVVPEYWGVFIIIDILNGDEGVIKHHVILRGNMPCGKVQYQGDVTEMSRTIPKKDATPGLWFPAGKLWTVWYVWINAIHWTAPNMEPAEFMTRKDIPMKDISRRDIGDGGHMVLQVCCIVNIKGPESRFNP